MGIYAIDYTQDFSGTMDRSNIVEHLEEQGFVEQGDIGEAIESRQGTILRNTKSVGNHVCTWVYEYEEHTIRQKLYNKIVCQFEAGKVQQVFGGYVAEYAACPNTHLRKTFEHKAAKARGITRIEISVYGCSRDDPLEYARIALEETIQSLQGKKLFYIQPCTKQWTNFAEKIDRCCMFVDHSSKSISFCRYGHSRTGRLGGVVVPIGKKDIEKVAMHTMADFGFQDCPIFRIDLLHCKEKTIHIAPLRCFRKERGAKTILCPTHLLDVEGKEYENRDGQAVYKVGGNANKQNYFIATKEAKDDNVGYVCNGRRGKKVEGRGSDTSKHVGSREGRFCTSNGRCNIV